MKVNIYEKHKHCKPDCVDHNTFIISLRKYNKPLQTKSKPTYYHSILPTFDKQASTSTIPHKNQTTMKNTKKIKSITKI
jgi:hypothetical protein